MNKEIKEKIFNLRAYLGTEENWILTDIEDYITNLQEKIDDLENRLENAVADCNLRLQEIKTLYRYTPEKGFELVGDDNEKK